MTAAELVKAGRLADALAALNQEIRQNPGDPARRVFLFQLNCVLGRYERALSQLQVLASIDAERSLFAQIFRPVITAEVLRHEVFCGRRSPLIFGEPEAWMGRLVQALGHVAAGQGEAARSLRDEAFAVAPAVGGTLNGSPFEWIADADARLGPMLELILDGKYYWVPFTRILKIEFEAPHDLRDLVWYPARFTWTNGGAVSGHVPTRYAKSAPVTDDALALARRTDWTETFDGYALGHGQRIFSTDQADHPLLECREIVFNQPMTATADE